MYKKFTYRRSSKHEPSKVYVDVWSEPTTNKSLAALELLNETLRSQEVSHWEKVLNFTKDKHSDFMWSKCSSSDKLRILRGFFNRRFLEKSKLICHYCKTVVSLQDTDRKKIEPIQQPLIIKCLWLKNQIGLMRLIC